MKFVMWAGGVAVVVAAAYVWSGAGRASGGDAVQAEAAAGPVSLVALPIEGMTCSGCAISVKTALGGLDGVQGAKVDVEKGTAVVTYREGAVTVEQMVEAVNRTGFIARKPRG